MTRPNPYEELAAEGERPPYAGRGAPQGAAQGGAPRDLRSGGGPNGPGADAGRDQGLDATATDLDPVPSGSGEKDVLGLSLRSDYDDSAYEDRMPYLRAVRRRRRSRLRRTVKVVIALCVVLAFLAVGDRWAALYAENKAAKKVQDALKLHAEPEVHINGFPFVTQLAGGRLDNVDVTIPDMPAGRISVAQVKGSINDVRIVGDAPTSIKGAVLGRMHGDVLLDFDDLDRELGTSQVDFTAGKSPDTVLANGQLPVAGEKVTVRAKAHLRRNGDHGVGTTVDDMRLDVPGLFSYEPGRHGGLRLAKPLAKRIQHDTAKAHALFRVGSVAKRFGLTDHRAQQVRRSEPAMHRLTGRRHFVDKLMKVNMLDVLMKNPALLKKVGIDPALLEGLKKIQEPQLADKMELNVRLPKMPGDVRLRRISVAKDGIHGKVTGVDVPVGKGAKDGQGAHAKSAPQKPRKGDGGGDGASHGKPEDAEKESAER